MIVLPVQAIVKNRFPIPIPALAYREVGLPLSGNPSMIVVAM